MILESGNASAADSTSPPSALRHSLRLRRADANRKRLFRARSLWSILLDLAREHAPANRFRFLPITTKPTPSRSLVNRRGI